MNVQFLVGDSTSYNALATKDSGSFYLLQDIGELYFSDKKITNAADLATAISRIAQNESDISTINTTLTKLENAESTAGSIRAIIKSYFDSYRAADLIYTDEEGTVGQEGYKAAVSVKDALDTLNAAVGSGGSVDSKIATAIGALDASVSQSAGSDGLALSVTEVDGVITGISGSITANTYDSYGSASSVQSAITGTSADAATDLTLNGLSAKAGAAQVAAAAAQSDVDDLADLVGELPATATATDVVGYVDEKIAEVTGDASDLEARVGANEDAIELLNKTDGTTGSVKKTVDDAIAAVIADAPASFDTLKEISDWISGHAGDASAMNSQIQANKTAIGVASQEESEPGAGDAVAATGLHKKIEDETARATTAESGLNTRLAALEGSGSGSIADQIDSAIAGLDGSATIASKSGNVVTIKTGVSEVDGVVSNDSGTDIVLADVSVSGSSSDVSILDAAGHYTATTVEGALAEIATKLTWQSF